MKKLSYYIIGLLFAAVTDSFSQATVDIHFGPPAWAPSAPVTVQYYYLPDVEMYYDVPAKQYIYLRKGAWVRTSALPARYRGYDLYQSHPIYLTNYRGNTPYVLYKEHKVKYKGNGWKRGHRGKK